MCAPVMCAPVMRAPVMRAPVMCAPVMHAPMMCAPVMCAPVMRAPVMHAPLMHEPMMCAPVMCAPMMCASMASCVLTPCTLALCPDYQYHWRRLLHLAVQYRRIADPEMPVLWLDKLPQDLLKDGYSTDFYFIRSEWCILVMEYIARTPVKIVWGYSMKCYS